MEKNKPLSTLKKKFSMNNIVVGILTFIIISCIILLIISLFIVKSTAIDIENKINTLSNNIKQCPHVNINEKSKSFFLELQLIVRNLFDSSMMTVLFEVFSIILVSFGAAILLRIERGYKTLKNESDKLKNDHNIILQKSKIIDSFLKSQTISNSISISLSNSYHLINLIRISIKDKQILSEYLPDFIDTMKIVEQELINAKQEKIGLPRSSILMQDDLLNQIYYILANLKLYDNKIINEGIKAVTSCRKIIEETPFVNWYKTKLDLLIY